MIPTPRTEAAIDAPMNGPDGLDVVKRLTALCVALERELAMARKELAQVTSDFQAECDHTFVTEDHSFSHEFGTEKIFVCRCTKCGKDAEPGDEPEPDEAGCDDGDFGDRDKVP